MSTRHGILEHSSNAVMMEETIEACVRRLFERLPRMMTASSSDGQLEYVNQEALELFGVSFEDMAGTKWVNLLHPDDAPGAFHEWTRCSTAGLPFKYCYRARVRDGSYRWCQSLAKPLLDERGDVIKFYGTLTDIDEPACNDEVGGENKRSLRPAESSIDDVRLSRVLEYIQANIDDEMTLADLAEVAGYSPFHFSRKFTHAIGVPPRRYICHRRLEKAMAELATGRIPLAEIALNAHFSSQASFTRAFRRTTGMTPKEYQRRNLHSSQGTRPGSHRAEEDVSPALQAA